MLTTARSSTRKLSPELTALHLTTAESEHDLANQEVARGVVYMCEFLGSHE